MFSIDSGLGGRSYHFDFLTVGSWTWSASRPRLVDRPDMSGRIGLGEARAEYDIS